MGYPAYPEYSLTDTGVPYPKDWTIERLRFSIVSNPVKSEVNDWDEDELVSFVPMDSVGEYGGIDCSQERPIGEVYGGYTYFIDGDILVAKITPCFENGKGAIAHGLTNGVGFGTTEFHVMRPLEDLSERWLFYLSLSDAFRKIGASEMLGAGGQKRVPESFIKNFRVGLPSPSEQQHIADFLDWKTGQIDALIAKKRQLIEKLQEQRIAVITRAVTKGLNPDAPMKDSGIPWLGEVPEHWEVRRLKFIFPTLFSGVSVNSDNTPSLDGSIAILKTSAVYGNRFKPEENKRVVEDEIDRVACEVTKDSLIISRMNTPELVGNCGYVDRDYANLYLPDRLWIARFSEQPKSYGKFAWYLVTSHPIASLTGILATGTSGSMKNLTQEAFLDIYVGVPPLEEQVEIASNLDCKTAKLDALEEKASEAITRLTEYRTALITAATTGRIDVRDVAIPTSSAEQLNLAFAEDEEHRA